MVHLVLREEKVFINGASNNGMTVNNGLRKGFYIFRECEDFGYVIQKEGTNTLIVPGHSEYEDLLNAYKDCKL